MQAAVDLLAKAASIEKTFLIHIVPLMVTLLMRLIGWSRLYADTWWWSMALQSTTLLSRLDRSASNTNRWLRRVSSGPERIKDGSLFCQRKANNYINLNYVATNTASNVYGAHYDIRKMRRTLVLSEP